MVDTNRKRLSECTVE